MLQAENSETDLNYKFAIISTDATNIVMERVYSEN